MGDSQHSQKENSQAEKISLRVFLSQWGVSGEGATEIDNLQSETSNSEKLPLPSPSKGMSEAKVEQQSTETLSFRCWCERCRLTRGRIVKQSRATEVGWGEGATFNSATGKQLQELNKINCHAEFISASSHHQVITTPEKQSDHGEISPVARFRNKFGMTSPSKGMSEAKVEQQSTETLSFRCWCERCRLTRGRIVKQTQVSELGWGEGSTFNSATGKQLQEPNNVTNKKAAFTLAEVLITLGIIGVVAALTLPALLTNVQSKIRGEQKRSVMYKFSLATEKMARLNLIGPYDSTDAFVDELQKHLKISKRCNASNLRGCWPYDTVDLGNGKTWDISKTKTGKQLGMNKDDDNDYTSDNVGIVTADGTPMILSYNKKCKAIDSLEKLSWTTTDNKPLSNSSASCVAAVYEINGTGKPNKLSNDVVLFNANKLGSGCAFEVGSTCYTAVFSPKPLTYDECMAQKDNLGIECCSPDWCRNTDYWAGAVKQCGGASKMPTMDDLGKLASQLYKGNPSIGAKQDAEHLQWDQDAATALGFTSSGFYLWSSEENGSPGAYYRGFDSTYSYFYATNRSMYSGIQAVCIAD